jgi:pyrimidine operon attenuation protein/uracil phosphoribosyltransferase
MTPTDEQDEERVLLDAAGVATVLDALTKALVEREGGLADVALVGIRTGGHALAVRLASRLAALAQPVPLGAIDIALYRDDVFEGLPRPEVGSTELPFSLPGRSIVLVDDVLYTGRTVRAALDALVDYGRPKAVQLAVLVDRGHRELPIQADFVGMRLATSKDEQIKVRLSDDPGQDRVVVRRRRRS